MAQVYPFGQAIDVGNADQIRQLASQFYHQGYDPQQIAQQLSNNPFGVSYQELAGMGFGHMGANGANPPVDGSGGYGTGGGGGSYGPAMYHYSLADKIGALNNLYNLMYGNLQNMEVDQRNRLNKGYDTQRGNLQTQYENNQTVLPWQFVGRGTRYSSDYENAIKSAADVYNQNRDSIQQDQEAKLAALGQEFAPKYAGIDTARSQLGGMNPDFYGTEDQFRQAQNSLDQQIGSVNQQMAGIGTQGDFINKVNSINPAANNGSKALQGQLDQLANASIPGYAKQTIANGLIKQGGGDQSSYWTDYFQKQTNGQNTSLSG